MESVPAYPVASRVAPLYRVGAHGEIGLDRDHRRIYVRGVAVLEVVDRDELPE